MNTHRSAIRQQGAAALIVVLVLFFIMSLVAAYTSRGMIFEQRTSINQLRSTQALDVGDAGVEWAITKLNAGLLGAASCDTDTTGTSTFRQRYLAFAADGLITSPGTASATCVMQPGVGWACSCPTAGSTIPAAAGGPSPAFRVYFGPDNGAPRANLIRVTVSACTDASPNCLANPQIPEPGRGNVVVSASLGLKGAIDTIPLAAITVPKDAGVPNSLTVTGGASLVAYNSIQGGAGIAIQAGGGVAATPPSTIVVGGAPGMPAELAKLENDASLSKEAAGGGLRNSSDAGACAAGDTNLGCSFNRTFTSFFGAPREIYKRQPALVRCPGPCDSAALSQLAAKNPRSVILVAGDATLDASLGSAADPVVLVVEGNVNFSGAGTVITGFIYGTTGAWTVNGTPRLDGGIASELPVVLSGPAGSSLEVRYDLPALTKLRYEYGSFVRVPGSWRDFPAPT